MRLTWEEVREMHKSDLVSFEAHGHDHINLAEASSDIGMLTRELGACRDAIFQNLGYKVRYIAYAAGHKNSAVMGFVKDVGFEAAFSISEGLIKKEGNPYAIKRTQVDRTMSFFLFRARLTGAVDLNRKFIDFFRNAYEKK